jgi:hypothetical protein
MLSIKNPFGGEKLVPLANLVALHKLDPKPGVFPKPGTRLLLSFHLNGEHSTQFVTCGEEVEVIRDRLSSEHGIRTQLFQGPKGSSYLCIDRIQSISPSDEGGSVIKLTTGPRTYWRCYVVDPPERVAKLLGLDISSTR